MVPILVSFLFDPTFVGIVVESGVIKIMKGNPRLLSLFSEIDAFFGKKLINVKAWIFFLLSVNGNFTRNSSRNRVIRLHYFGLYSQIKVLVLSNLHNDLLQLLHCLPFLGCAIAQIEVGVFFGEGISLRNFLALLSVDIETLVRPTD